MFYEIGAVGIMQSPKLFARVVPEDQSFDDNYAGIFRFRFWLYGEWIEVVVDDRLPYWPDGNLVFCSNKQQPDEYWGPLLVYLFYFYFLNFLSIYVIYI